MTRSTAYTIVPTRFEDGRHDTIKQGLEAAGFRVRDGQGVPKEGDILVTWTRFQHGKEQICERFERQGGRVLVAEEGYIRNVRGKKHFSLAWHDHGGNGTWYVGDEERLRSFGLEMAPMREVGEHIIVTEQRSIGSKVMASPKGWHEDVKRRLSRLTNRKVIVRWHPRTRTNKQGAANQPSAEEQLRNCHAVVTWSSAFAVTALLQGVPVFAEAPKSVLDGAVNRGLEHIDHPIMYERLPALNRMAWAMWSVEEIASGEAIRYLLRVPK
jgi:hypothetical protein